MKEKVAFGRNGMRMMDLHAHFYCLSEHFSGRSKERLREAERELALRRDFGIATCFSGGTPEEWAFLSRFREREELLLSFGVHPWQSDQYDPDAYREVLAQADFLGEIGMDSVWCEIPLKEQRKVFARQLDLAAERKKPVVLHTKGQEREIARMTEGFPGPVLVHWYSGGEEGYEAFAAQGCFFTLGPDLAEVCGAFGLPGLEASRLYRRMLRELPPECLFLETDGLTSIEWLKNDNPLPLTEIPAYLGRNQAFLARQKGLEEKELLALQRQSLGKCC